VIKHSYIILLAATLLISCTQEGVQEIGREMKFRLVSESIGGTRAADGVNDAFAFPVDFMVAVDGENTIYTATAVNTNMTSAAPASFPISGNSVRVQAFYPAFAMQASDTPQTFTVTYNQDQSNIGTDNYRVSDLMYGLPQESFADIDGSGPTRKVKVTTQAIPLVFEHMMVKIRVEVSIVNGGAKVKGIKMKNVKRSIDFDTDDASFPNPATSADDGLGDYVIMYDDATGTTSDFTCTALIPQQDLATGTAFIDVVVGSYPSDVTMTYKLHEEANFVSGKQYIYSLSVSMTELGVKCSIADWDAGATSSEFTQTQKI
jgi:hypothetical protein